MATHSALFFFVVTRWPGVFICCQKKTYLRSLTSQVVYHHKCKRSLSDSNVIGMMHQECGCEYFGAPRVQTCSCGA